MSIYLGNLSHDINQENILEQLSKFGTVTKVIIPRDRDSGKGRGFAFVHMESEDEESSAIDALDGKQWLGTTIKVNRAKTKTNRDQS